MSSPGETDDLLDAHDIYRILIDTATEALGADFRRLQSDNLAGEVTEQALEFLRAHFAAGPEAIGSMMAGRTEEGVGEPETVALQTSILSTDLLTELAR